MRCGFVDAEVYPALDRQVALIRALRPATHEGDGLLRVPLSILGRRIAERTKGVLSAG